MSNGKEQKGNECQPALQPEYTESKRQDRKDSHGDGNTHNGFKKGAVGLFFDHVANPEGIID